MTIVDQKDETEEFKPITTNNLDFIARNIIYPEPHSSDQQQDVSLENIMDHLGGTRGEIARLSDLFKKRTETGKNK